MKIIFDFLRTNFPIETFAVLLTLSVTGLVGWVKYLRARARLHGGVHDETVVFQLNRVRHLPAGGKTVFFRTVGFAEVEDIIHNPALLKWFGEQLLKTTPKNPIIPLEGPLGTAARIEFFNFFSGENATSSHPLDNYIMVITRETGVTKRAQVRVFLITETDLREFHQWEKAATICSESRYNFARIMSLHQIAVEYFSNRRESIDAPGKWPIIEAGLNPNYKPQNSFGVLWNEGAAADLLAKVGMA